MTFAGDHQLRQLPQPFHLTYDDLYITHTLTTSPLLLASFNDRIQALLW